MAEQQGQTPEGLALKDIPIEVTISVGRARPLVRDLLAMDQNAVLTLDSRVDDPVEVTIGGRLIARGQLEEAEGAEGQLAVRLTEVITDGLPLG